MDAVRQHNMAQNCEGNEREDEDNNKDREEEEEDKDKDRNAYVEKI